MHILLLVTKADLGGAQKRVFDLARSYVREGEEVTVGFGEGDFLKEKLEEENISYYQFRHLKRSHGIRELVRFVFEVRKYVKRERPDIVHANSSNTLPGALGAKLQWRRSRRPKTVFTFRGLSVLDPNAKTPWHKRVIYKKYFQFFLKYIDKPVFQCDQNMHDAGAMKLVLSGARIYPGIDLGELDFLSRENAKWQIEKELSISLEDAFLIGSVGRLGEQKNYSFLLDSFHRILEVKENAVLVLFGDGPQREQLESLAREKGLERHVFFYGETAQASSLLRALDLFILPSLYEGISVALSEALIAGLPMLASNVGGNAELIYGKHSAVYEPNDPDELLEKLRDILSPSGIEREEGGTLDDHINKFLLENSSANYLKLYHSQD